MKTSEVEKQTGISKQTILYYEKEGLLFPGRDENGYRNYSDNDVQSLLMIKLLRTMMIGIDDIKLVLNNELSLQECLQIQHSFVEDSIDALNQTKETIHFYKEKNIPIIPALNEVDKINEKNILGYKKTSNTLTIGRKLTKAYFIRKIVLQVIFSIAVGIASYYGMNVDSILFGIGCSICMIVVFIISYVLGCGELGAFTTQNNATKFIEFNQTGIAYVEESVKGRIRYAMSTLLGKDALTYVNYHDIQFVELKHVNRYMKILGSNVSTNMDTTDYCFSMKDGRHYTIINPILLENDRELIDIIIHEKINNR